MAYADACYLEWHPWSTDRVMGLNHQMASLSCALGEAYYLNRTLLFPKHLCLDIRHEARLSRQRQADPHCSSHGVKAFSLPVRDILDIEALRRVVSLRLLRYNASGRPEPASILAGTRAMGSQVADVDRKWASTRVAAEYPCSRTLLVRRRVSSFWFRPCGYKITDSSRLVGRLGRMVRAPDRPAAPFQLTHMLRSGIFYSAHIKAAARAVRRAIDGPFAAVHVRRSDKFATGCDRAQFSVADCRRMELMTRPEALGQAMSLWLPRGARVYIGSTEPPAYFDGLRQRFSLHFAEDFAAELANITNNYALYAVETLLLLGSASMVETCAPARARVRTHSPQRVAEHRPLCSRPLMPPTPPWASALGDPGLPLRRLQPPVLGPLRRGPSGPPSCAVGYANEWLTEACFPAATLRAERAVGRRGDTHAPAARASRERSQRSLAHRRRLRQTSDGARRVAHGGGTGSLVTCADGEGVVAGGVYYGRACADNPPCGEMSFVPNGKRPPAGCGATLSLAAGRHSSEACSRQ